MRGLIIYVEAPEASAVSVSLALLPCDFAPPPYPGTFRFLLYLFTVIPSDAHCHPFGLEYQPNLFLFPISPNTLHLRIWLTYPWFSTRARRVSTVQTFFQVVP